MRINKNQEVIDGILAGDQKVIKAFYKKNLPYVRKFITTNGGRLEDVEDIFQDALILIYHKLRNGSLDLQASIHSYFIGVCKIKWYNKVRRQQKMVYNDEIITNRIDDQLSLLDSITLKDQEQLYNKHYAKLSDANKTILQLFFDGKSMREIANITGYSEGYTRKKKFEIKELLIGLVKRDSVYAELA